MRWLSNFRFWGRNPLTIVEFVIGAASVIAGIYIMSPALAYSTQINGAGAIVSMLGHPIGLTIYGFIFFISGAIMIAGIVKRRYKWRSTGLFMNACVRTYGLIGTFIIQGILPLSWLSSLVVLIIVLICYMTVRGFIHRGIEA